jgi:hypothetical protein
MAITAGTYKARASGECVLGESKTKGTPFIEFYLTILEGENKGGRVRWTGYFTEKTNERSVQSLQTCGWQGEDLSEFSDGGLHGLDSNDVEIVVELESYENAEGETRSAPRVAWINRTGGFLNKASAMNEGAAAAFGDRMRGLVLKIKEKNPQLASAKAPARNPSSPPAASDVLDEEIPF